MLDLRVKRNFIRHFQIQPIANSRWMANRIRESSLFSQVASTPIVPPMVGNAFFAENISDICAELGIPENRTFISLGARSLDDRFKGIPEFLEHLSRETDLADKLTVLLFGDGRIEVPANLDVRLLGNITDPHKLAKVYHTSAMFISPSKMETFGMTLAEAQACGTPVVAFDVGGIRDAVAVEDTGTLVQSGDFLGLFAHLKNVISKPEWFKASDPSAEIGWQHDFTQIT